MADDSCEREMKIEAAARLNCQNRLSKTARSLRMLKWATVIGGPILVAAASGLGFAIGARRERRRALAQGEES